MAEYKVIAYCAPTKKKVFYSGETITSEDLEEGEGDELVKDGFVILISDDELLEKQIDEEEKSKKKKENQTIKS